MNKLSIAFLAAFALTAPVLADDAHHPEKAAPAPTTAADAVPMPPPAQKAQAGPRHKPGAKAAMMECPMMSGEMHEHMQAMEKHMEAMQGMMEKMMQRMEAMPPAK